MILDVLRQLGINRDISSEEREACQIAADRLYRMAVKLNHIEVAEKHLKAFALKVSMLVGDETTGPLIEEAGALLDDMYWEERSK